MAEPIGALRAVLSASSAEFERDMRSARNSVRKHGGNMQKDMRRTGASFDVATKSLVNMRKAMSMLMGVVGIGSLAAFTKKTIDLSDALAKTADKIGLTTDNLQIYRYAAERSGVATKALDMGMQRFTRRLAEAAQGGGELKGVLEQYNIAVRDSSGAIRTTDAVLDDLAEAIRNAESDSERLRIAFKAFDSEGAALVNMLRGGKQGLDEFRVRARDLGIVIDEKLLRGAENVADAITDLTKTLSTSFQAAILTLAPEMEKIAVDMTNWVSANREFLTQDVPGHLKNIAEGAKGLKSVYDSIPDDVKGAAGAGIVGRIVFGSWGAAKMVAMLALMNSQLDKMGMGLKSAAFSFKELMEHSRKAWDEAPDWIKKMMTFSVADMLPKPKGVVPGEMSEHERRRLGLIPNVIPGTMSEHEKRRLGLSQPLPPKPPAAPGERPWTSSDQFMEDMGLNDFSLLEKAEQERLESITKSFDEYIQAVDDGFARHVGSQEKFFQKTKEKNEDLVGLTERTAWAMQENFSNLFFDAFSGELSTMEDYYRALMRSLLRITTDYMAQITAKMLFGKSVGGGGEIGGLLGSLVKGIVGAIGGSGGSGGAYLGAAADIYHSGGIVGHGARPQRIVSAGVFAGAQRYHNGLRADEFPAILQKGEAVIPRGGGAAPAVTIAPVFQIQAIDTRTGAEFVRANMPVVAGELMDMMKHSPELSGFFRKGA